MEIVRPHPNPQDAEQVEHMIGMGASIEYIAHHLHVDPDTISLHYPSQLQFGVQEANLRVARTMFNLAISGHHPNMTVKWLQMRANWSDALPTELRTPDELEAEQQQARQKLLTLLNRSSKQA